MFQVTSERGKTGPSAAVWNIVKLQTAKERRSSHWLEHVMFHGPDERADALGPDSAHSEDGAVGRDLGGP
jgi:hypothetical protein